MRTYVLLAQILWSIVLWGDVYAWDTGWPKEDEVSALPEYCRPLPFIGGRAADYDTNSPIWKKWYPILGEGYKHTHHYCAGINFTIRSFRVRGNASDVEGLLTAAVNEFEYVLYHSPKDFVLIPEIRTQRARVFLRLKNPKKARADFQAAINSNPEYMPAYAGMIDLLIGSGEKAEARRFYEAGIKVRPDSNALKRFETLFADKAGQR